MPFPEGMAASCGQGAQAVGPVEVWKATPREPGLRCLEGVETNPPFPLLCPPGLPGPGLSPIPGAGRPCPSKVSSEPVSPRPFLGACALRSPLHQGPQEWLLGRRAPRSTQAAGHLLPDRPPCALVSPSASSHGCCENQPDDGGGVRFREGCAQLPAPRWSSLPSCQEPWLWAARVDLIAPHSPPGGCMALLEEVQAPNCRHRVSPTPLPHWRAPVPFQPAPEEAELDGGWGRRAGALTLNPRIFAWHQPSKPRCPALVWGRDYLCHLLDYFCPRSPKPTPPTMMGRPLGVGLRVTHDACFQGTCFSETSV